MMEYFKNIGTLEELRKQYKELLKKYHPDNPAGSTEITQKINSEYDRIFQKLRNEYERNCESEGDQDSWKKWKYNFNEDLKLREALQKIIMFSGINIEIIGSWIWVDGNTKPYRKEFKEYGYHWGSEKKKWYFHTDTFRKKSNRKLSMEEIRQYYGNEKIDTEKEKYIKANT